MESITDGQTVELINLVGAAGLNGRQGKVAPNLKGLRGTVHHPP